MRSSCIRLPADNITLDQVRAIYSANITNWGQLKGLDSPIKTYVSRPRKGLSGVEVSTKKWCLKGKILSFRLISLMSSIKRPLANRAGNREYKLSLSVGITWYDPERPLTIAELLVRGDRAMYENKKDRKSQKE